MSTLRPETALRAVLMDAAPVTAIIGTRLTRSVAPQKSPHPFGIFARTKTEPEYHTAGRSDLREVEVMFAWYHTDFDALADLVEKVEDALSGFAGDVAVESQTVNIDTAYLTNEWDGDVLTADGSGEPLYCINQTFRVAYNLNLD